MEDAYCKAVKRFQDVCEWQAREMFVLTEQPSNPFYIEAYMKAVEAKLEAAKNMNDEFRKIYG